MAEDRHYTDCPKCRFTAHEGSCVWCASKGSIPLCPAVGEFVVVDEVRKNQSGEEGVQTLPLLVMKAARVADTKGRAMVVLSGWLFANPPIGARPMEFRSRVEGPSPELECWRWKDRRS